MSGPKVVRIVTREEILAICEGQLARVDAALADWRQIGTRNDCIDDAALAEAERRRAVLASHIAADRFLDLQKEAPREEAFLRSDIEARLAQLAAREAEGRARAKRQKEAGQSLAAALGRAGKAPGGAELARLISGDADALASAFALLGAAGGAEQASREQAGRLGEGAQRRTFSDWLTAADLGPEEPEIERLDARIAELAMVDERILADAWRARLDDAAAADGGRRSLLLDALGADIGRALASAKQRRRHLDALSALLAEAGATGLDISQWQRDPLEMDDAEAMRCADDVRAALASLRAGRAAVDRRAAVLEALAGLGYEVREDMSAAWADDGGLVLANPSRPGYGMEVRGGGEAAERIQMRAVAFETGGVGPDPGRDREAETLWCGDVTRLRAELAADGGELAIERALAIGAVPLKRIALAENLDPGHRTTAPAPARRTLPPR